MKQINTIQEICMANFFKSINSKINNKIGKEMGKLDPRLQSIVGAFFPGLGGGVENYRDNAFLDELANRSSTLQQQVAMAGNINVIDQQGAKPDNIDWRARLRPKNGGESLIYGLENDPNGLLAPLKKTGGLVWMETPLIFLAGLNEYNEHLAHGMNYPVVTYNYSRPPTLPITADFFANDVYEAQYLLAIIHFCRSVTKAYFGEAAIDQGRYGTPPPVMLFEYMGDHGFNKVPVVVRDYNLQLPNDVDYIPVKSKIAGSDSPEQTTYVPVRFNLQINLTPAYTPKKTRKKFDVEAFRNGKLYKDGFI